MFARVRVLVFWSCVCRRACVAGVFLSCLPVPVALFLREGVGPVKMTGFERGGGQGLQRYLSLGALQTQGMSYGTDPEVRPYASACRGTRRQDCRQRVFNGRVVIEVIRALGRVFGRGNCPMRHRARSFLLVRCRYPKIPIQEMTKQQCSFQLPACEVQVRP